MAGITLLDGVTTVGYGDPIAQGAIESLTFTASSADGVWQPQTLVTLYTIPTATSEDYTPLTSDCGFLLGFNSDSTIKITAPGAGKYVVGRVQTIGAGQSAITLTMESKV